MRPGLMLQYPEARSAYPRTSHRCRRLRGLESQFYNANHPVCLLALQATLILRKRMGCWSEVISSELN